MAMTDAHIEEMRSISVRLFAAAASGDLDEMRAIYAPDAEIWHNNDGIVQNVEQSLAVLRWVAANVRDFRYEDVRWQPTPDGFIEQHVVCGTNAKGAPFRMTACAIVTVAGGRITRLDEYLDSAQIAAMTGA